MPLVASFLFLCSLVGRRPPAATTATRRGAVPQCCSLLLRAPASSFSRLMVLCSKSSLPRRRHRWSAAAASLRRPAQQRKEKANDHHVPPRRGRASAHQQPAQRCRSACSLLPCCLSRLLDVAVLQARRAHPLARRERHVLVLGHPLRIRRKVREHRLQLLLLRVKALVRLQQSWKRNTAVGLWCVRETRQRVSVPAPPARGAQGTAA